MLLEQRTVLNTCNWDALFSLLLWKRPSEIQLPSSRKRKHVSAETNLTFSHLLRILKHWRLTVWTMT